MSRIRLEVRAQGIVQGVGFRPFVHPVAARLGIGGTVRNDGGGAMIEVEGPPDRIAEFLATVERDAPPLAVIERLVTREIAPCGDTASSAREVPRL